MARPLRLQAPGLTYHVVSRGVGRMAIYLDDGDRTEFLELLGDAVARYQLTCHAYCLMSNHYHVLLTTRGPNLSSAVKLVNGTYGQWWNRRRGRVGHVFQGRFWSQIVQDESYLLTVSRYIVLNPVRAGLAATPGDWRWSSYPATSGTTPVPPFLTTSWVLDRFGREPEARRRYATFVAAADPAESLPGGGVLGTPEFAAQFAEVREVASREIPFKAFRRTAPPLAEIFKDAAARSPCCLAAALAQAPVTPPRRSRASWESTEARPAG